MSGSKRSADQIGNNSETDKAGKKKNEGAGAGCTFSEGSSGAKIKAYLDKHLGLLTQITTLDEYREPVASDQYFTGYMDKKYPSLDFSKVHAYRLFDSKTKTFEHFAALLDLNNGEDLDKNPIYIINPKNEDGETVKLMDNFREYMQEVWLLYLDCGEEEDEETTCIDRDKALDAIKDLRQFAEDTLEPEEEITAETFGIESIDGSGGEDGDEEDSNDEDN